MAYGFSGSIGRGSVEEEILTSQRWRKENGRVPL
jgi:hypothetical protein